MCLCILALQTVPPICLFLNLVGYSLQHRGLTENACHRQCTVDAEEHMTAVPKLCASLRRLDSYRRRGDGPRRKAAWSYTARWMRFTDLSGVCYMYFLSFFR